MVSPNLNEKKIDNLTINNSTKKLFQVIYSSQKEEVEKNFNIPKIKVSELISKMAFYYEKIRNIVDYNEEYLLRKNAILRILKRLIIIEGVIKVSRSDEIAKSLLIELIRAGYLKNNTVPELKIKEIGNLIEKYLKLRNYWLAKQPSFFRSAISNDKKAEKGVENFTNWIIAIAASEIEENLGINKVKKTIVSNIYEELGKSISISDNQRYEKDLEIQIYLSIHRSYLKFDDEMLANILFKYFNPNWKNAKDEDIAKISQNIDILSQSISKQLNHPLKNQIDKITNKYTVYYSILNEVISEEPVNTYYELKSDPVSFTRRIKKICSKKYKEIKNKLWRAAIRSIIYIFITKSLLVFLLEIPFIVYMKEEINFISLGINISFPALLLLVIVLFTKTPSEDNTKKIIKGIEDLTFKSFDEREIHNLRSPVKRGNVITYIFGILYAITFFISFGFVVWILQVINFNWISIIIFLFFLAFVSFFSIRIRKGTKALFIVDQKENIITFFADFFYIPIAVVGKWLSEKFNRINVFVIFLDFIIEAPFKIFIQIAEEWTKYVKERKDEIM